MPELNPAQAVIERYEYDPVQFAVEFFGIIPDETQAAILNGIAHSERRISWRSGHGVGKTTTLAIAIVHRLVVKFPQRTVCTAPTSKQLFKALAADVKKLIKRLPPELCGLFEIKTDSITLVLAPEESYVTFATSRPEMPEALAGIHSDWVLLIADEASGIHEKVFESASGSMSGHNATTVLTGNPVRTAGLFYDSHHKLKDIWKTYHTSCEGHPRVTPDYMMDMARKYGLGANAYRVHVLGEFPTGEDDTVIPFELIESAYMRDVEPTRRTKPIWGVDCARFGHDESALAKRRANALTEKVRVWKGIDTMGLVGRIKFSWDQTPKDDQPSAINVDVIGIGAGVVDRLVELGLPANGINVSESAALTEGNDRLRDDLWFFGKDWLEKRDCTLDKDEQLGDELKVPKFDFTSAGKRKVESKKAMKKRGFKSPNRADAFLLTFASEAVVAAGHTAGNPTTDWTKPLKRNVMGGV